MGNPYPAVDPNLDDLGRLYDDLHLLRGEILAGSAKRLVRLADRPLDEAQRKSATNLAHYLGLREQDLRPLQVRLAQAGLSSLGRCESHVIANIDNILDTLSRALHRKVSAPDKVVAPHFFEGWAILGNNAETLFGSNARERQTRILVTLGADAAADFNNVKNLVLAGADSFRINCAHDDVSVWETLVRYVRRAAQETGYPCRVLIDLAGHKIRTQVPQCGSGVLHIKIKRDLYGQIRVPGTVALFGESYLNAVETLAARDIQGGLRLPDGYLNKMQPGDRLSIRDMRHKKRFLTVVGRLSEGALLGQCDHGIYAGEGNQVRWRPAGGGGSTWSESFPIVGVVMQCPAVDVKTGDRVLLANCSITDQCNLDHCEPDVVGIVACTVPSIVEQLELGTAVWIDDGKIGAEVERKSPVGAVLRVLRAGPAGARIKSDKGINFPGLSLGLPHLTAKDLTDLDFVCRNADMVGFSFVETPQDVLSLVAELRRRSASSVAIVVKVETQRAVQNLPEILLNLIGVHPLAVMIARGDLSIELGSVRMAEIQEEILWLCEAAHVPVIWATQVLETVSKKGVRSRPEFTDAAMGVRAECVMLNKGPHVVDAIRSLSAVLLRMQGHQQKKVSRLRALRWGRVDPADDAVVDRS